MTNEALTPTESKWLRDYRNEHPAANRWAKGSEKVSHNEQTQSRIFRLVEHLRRRDDCPIGRPFALLEALDSVVDLETGWRERPSPTSAAAAAIVGYKLFFGSTPPLAGQDWPAGFARVYQCETEFACIGLRAQGFEPIVFDGIDPAAYVWAIYEKLERGKAWAEIVRAGMHSAIEPMCVAAVPDEAVAPSMFPHVPGTDRSAVVAAAR
ncbi:MAG TPA: hypothetical protein VIT43_01965 [Candidatus Dormibacteraeota bacterium]